MKARRKLILAGVTVAAAALLLASAGFAALSKNTTAPNFKAATLTGKQFELQDLRGRVVLLDFWATWCPPCRNEAPQLQKLWEKYKDKGLVVIGIALDSGDDAALRKFAADNELTYWLVNDRSGAIAAKYRIGPIPTTYIVSPSGAISRVHIGFAPGMEKDFDREIKALLPAPGELQNFKPLGT